MAVSKRLRHEILRRDNHTCRYCGAKAPDVMLAIDHVTPVTLGGTDEPSNLVAACVDCNAGKSSIPAGAPMVDDVTLESVRWSAAIEEANALAAADLDRLISVREAFERRWASWESKLIGSKSYPLPDNWAVSIDQISAAGLSPALIEDAVDIAMQGPAYYDKKWPYFCGVCWKKIRKLQEVAKHLLAVTEGDSE